jgi:predicted MFS family arabinose efflux permease
MTLRAISAPLVNAFIGIPRTIWMLSLVSLINRSGAMVICFLTLYLTQNLQFTIEEAGYAMSCYGIGAILGAYFGGKWTDKFGYKNVMVATLVGSGIFLLFAMFVKSFHGMCITLLLFNIIAEAFRPAASISIRSNSDEVIRTRSFSLFRVFINLAITIALSLGGFLIGFGWKWIFICDAITCFGAAMILLLLNLKVEKQEPIKAQASGFQFINAESALRDSQYVWFVVLTFLGAMVFMQIIWTVPAFFKESYQWSEAKIGLMSALNGFVVMLVELPLIYQIEGKKSTGWYIRLGILLYALSYLFLLLPSSSAFLAATMYMIFISFGEIFVMPFSSTWVTKRAPEHRQGQYMALYTMAYSISNVIAPWMGTQIIAHWGYNMLWVVIASISSITFLGFYKVMR